MAARVLSFRQWKTGLPRNGVATASQRQRTPPPGAYKNFAFRSRKKNYSARHRNYTIDSRSMRARDQPACPAALRFAANTEANMNTKDDPRRSAARDA
jgi:hypothetical protein